MLLWSTFLFFALLSLVVIATAVWCLYRLSRATLPPMRRAPPVSVIKPLCGIDEDLEENLRSHLRVTYAGEWELLLGVPSTDDAAYPVARRFEESHPDRVKVVVQSRSPGHNRKVNQLIGLTEAARHDTLVFVDSNVRVPTTHLTELASLLQVAGVGVVSNNFFGFGESTPGAALENMTLALFQGPPVALGMFFFPGNHLVGKSFAIERRTLESVGGWTRFKDVLAEDHQLGAQLRAKGIRSAMAPSPVLHLQTDVSVRRFWDRHLRWATIRANVQPPLFAIEPMLLPSMWTTLMVLARPFSVASWICWAAATLLLMALNEGVAMEGRGQGFKLRHLALVPFRDLLLLGIWIRAITNRHVTWRGARLRLLPKTRLTEPRAYARLLRMRERT